MHRILYLALALLVACAPAFGPPPAGPAPQLAPFPAPARAIAGRDDAIQTFRAVIDRMEPVVQQECRRRNPRGNCDFLVVLDTNPRQLPNAFQTIDRRTGRPILGFTVTLLDEVENADEIAFIFGHEAAHHILGHIPRREASARSGALILGALASLGGGDARAVREAQMIGAEMAARTYTRDLELEADEMGTRLAWRAGFDPLRGSAHFTRIPDPGNRFLATHPPNAQRQAVVRTTMARLQAGL